MCVSWGFFLTPVTLEKFFKKKRKKHIRRFFTAIKKFRSPTNRAPELDYGHKNKPKPDFLKKNHKRITLYLTKTKKKPQETHSPFFAAIKQSFGARLIGLRNFFTAIKK